MKSVDEYRADVLDGVHGLDVISRGLLEARGHVLAEDVVAPWPLPSFDNSSMDGYAVRHADLAAIPATLTVLGDIAAGDGSTMRVEPGTALRIMTGAPLPEGADAVVPVERSDGGAEVVVINEAVDRGAHIRREGEDVRAGDVVLIAGTTITSRQLAVLAAVGCGEVRVHRRPVVAILSTGSELVEPGAALGPGMICDSNSFMLVAACQEAGADAFRIPPVVDENEAFLNAVKSAAANADLILTSGGVSMGVYDTVKAVFNELGTVTFCKVAMNPGMPQGAGYVENTKIITLPGNPVSSYISFENFVRPVLRKMSGAREISRPMLVLRNETAFNSPAGKRQFVRGVIEGERVRVMGGQGSHVMGGMALANALIVVDEDVTTVEAGTSVNVIDLRENA